MASCDAAPKTASSFEPSVWGNFFIYYQPEILQRPEEWMRRAEKLKEEVRLLFGSCNDAMGKMNLLDAIQHLGINHLFEEEIDTAFGDIHGTYEDKIRSSSLHEISLWFRLLREHGLWVSPDVFEKFKIDDGSFSNEMANDTRGLLSLYNAAYLLIDGEPELEEAISFARCHLELLSRDSDLQFPAVGQVKRALHLPLPRTYNRLEARQYMLEYEQEESHNPILLELAKLDFNLLQRVHLNELKAFSEWCKDLYEYVELSYARERAVEVYTWSSICVCGEPLALTRVTFAKLMILLVLLDDTYDNMDATIHECRMLNVAIQRWDESAVFLLPEYLRKFYKKILSTFKEVEDEVVPANEKYRVACTKKEFQNLSVYYLEEAECFHQNGKPSFEDQLTLSIKTGCARFLCLLTTIGRGDAVTNKSFKWAFETSIDVDVFHACSKMGRLLNDIAVFKRRTNRADIPNCVECYINEHKVTSDVAIAKIESLVEDEWKTINRARFKHHALLPVVQVVIKSVVTLFYFYNDRRDAFTFTGELGNTIEDLYVKPIPM